MIRIRSFHAAGIAAALALAASALASCSGGVGGAGDVIDRMLAAYGCPGNLPLLTSYSGKGFMKQLPAGHVAMSYPFDVYQNGALQKTKMWRLSEGVPVDAHVRVIADTSSTEWTYSSGYGLVASWEVETLRYRFPLVLEWLPASGLEVRLLEDRPADGAWRVSFDNDGDLLTLVVDASSWLLRGVTIRSAADSTFLFEETYGDYRKVDGVWFPNRFSASLAGMKFSEYLIPAIELGADLPERFFAVLPEDMVLPPPANPAE